MNTKVKMQSRKRKCKVFIAFLSALCVLPLTLQAISYERKQIRIVGSSAVYPFAAAVAEHFAFHGDSKTPIVESIGTGGGFKIFCSGVGTNHPDIATASRPISKKEKELCKARGVKEIYEITLGYDGIVMTLSKSLPSFNVTRVQLYLALAQQVPVGGKLIKNPYQTWKDIDPSLPNIKIHVFGPSPTSGTRDAFIDLVMKPACKELSGIYKNWRCDHESLREDGAYVEVGANENMIIQKVVSSPGSIGIVSYSFLRQNRDRVDALAVEGVKPSFTAIIQKEYLISRPLYIYGKKDHEPIIPALHELLIEFLEEEVSGSSGYLAQRGGLIPLPDDERERQKQNLKQSLASIYLEAMVKTP